MTASSPLPFGIYVPSPTFFLPKQAAAYSALSSPLDLEAQLQHTLILAKAGIHGVVLLGSTGEAVHITVDERKELLSYVRKGLDAAGYADFPIIAGTGTNSTVETIALLQQAKDCGAVCGLVLAPSYFASAVTQEGLIEWYTLVADRSPIPIMIYYYPGVSNNLYIAPKTFEILAAHPNIVGTKLSHGNISHHTILAQNPIIKANNFHVFSGLGQQLLPIMTIGAAGAIDALAGIFPKTVVTLFNLSVAGKISEAQKIQYLVSCAEEAVAELGAVGVKEGVARYLKLGDKEGGRPPLAGGLSGGDAVWDAKYKSAFDAVAKLESTL
ncbi:dihydrodipicolinate synthase [Myxozyma melibiosi]|uniref:Dihydrodipicolinate synthase n=1 Tax=Myxozyma melibiosi TaxID=54550 RepID=A0ABR1F425_9ASCO